jgi:two-component system chemotaxis response regulator CheY
MERNTPLTPNFTAEAARDARPLVLLIDDDAGLRDSLVMVMEAFGFRVAAAEDGVAALQAIETEKPAVVVTDLHMPALDGFGFMNALRHAGINVPVICISGGTHGRSGALLHCAKTLGAIAVFEKPFSPLDLLDQINTLPAFGGTQH